MRFTQAFEDRLSDGFAVEYLHRLIFTSDATGSDNPVLESILGIAENGDDQVPGLVLAIDSNVSKAWPELSSRIAARCDGDNMPEMREVMEIPGGEAAKNTPEVVDAVQASIDRNRIDRGSWVLAVGGGAVIDAVGFASSTAHRGVRLLRMPTTVLAQLDAAIGVKNAVNRFGKKNFVGTFDVPRGVICDEELLATLDDHDWRTGFSEAVKIACLRDRPLMDRIIEASQGILKRDPDAARPIIRRCAELHLRHITRGGDPFERLEVRPLDFGHWAAHRLEAMSNWTIRHGDAVSIGIAIDTVYSRLCGLLGDEQCQVVLQALRGLDLPVHHDLLNDTDGLLSGLQEFREHLGGRLTITLLRDIGESVDVHEMDESLILKAISELSDFS
ncbi:MAG: 3-dehydroquinate synthase [Phycisphaerales bacterium]|nr:3-dehydroquinate synthase [Phycisphaerales bacterium]